jgi:membrane protein implicated in regulation of membrane protease activity
MKWKRPLAMIGIILIVSMYLIALFAAFSHHPDSNNWLMAAIYSTVAVPVFLYVLQLVARVLRPDDNKRTSPGDNKEE